MPKECKKARKFYSSHHYHHFHDFQSPHGFFHAYKHHLYYYRQQEFNLSHKSLQFLRPVFIIIILILIYLLFQFPLNRLVAVLLGLFILSQVLQLIWMTHLERRIFKPLLQLQEGVKEIAKGNYAVKVEDPPSNEIGFLIDSFNEMAERLLENEILKQEYEENRKNLIANISHDLKTPITAIRGYIEAIEDGVVASPQKMHQYLQIIRKNAEYINRLIDDLFLFSKLDMHQLEFHREEIPLRAFMDDLMAEFGFEFQEKGLGFQYTDETTEDVTINIDRKRIYQAVRNIMGNAVKYGPAAGLNVTTRLYGKEGFICLDIRDNGPGIPEDKLDKIFERFYRIDSERTKDLTSTGLGLAIAKELAEAHGGKITATSVIGEGTCFTLMLPF
jgi:signal transduction histidine kinase